MGRKATVETSMGTRPLVRNMKDVCTYTPWSWDSWNTDTERDMHVHACT